MGSEATIKVAEKRKVLLVVVVVVVVVGSKRFLMGFYRLRMTHKEKACCCRRELWLIASPHQTVCQKVSADLPKGDDVPLSRDRRPSSLVYRCVAFFDLKSEEFRREFLASVTPSVDVTSS